jgi:hypothetical protein
VTKGQPETDVQLSRRFETLRSSKINSGLRITHSFEADLGPEFSKSLDPDFEAMPQKKISYIVFDFCIILSRLCLLKNKIEQFNFTFSKFMCNPEHLIRIQQYH